MPRQYVSSKSIASITYWRKFAAHRLIYIGLAALFAVGLVAYFGTGPMSGMGGRVDTQSQQVIATVNGEDIPRTEYDNQWDQMKRYAGGGAETQQISMQGMLLNNLIDSAIMRAAAKKQGLTVSDAMVDRTIADMRKDRSGKPVPEADFEQMLQRQGLTVDELRDRLHQDLLPQVLQESMAASQKATEQDLLNSYDEAEVSHILISTSRLPEEQAKRKAQKIYEEIKAGKDFAALANANSDDTSNKPMKYDAKLKKEVPAGPPKGGDLGWAPLSNYVPEFSSAVRKLKPGDVSQPVKTQFGYHVIKLDAPIRQNLPKDFEKNKAKLLDDFRKKQSQKAFTNWMMEQRKSAKIVWHDPSLEWRYDYAKVNPMFQMPGQAQGDQAALLAELRKYVATNQSDGVAAIVLGQMIYPQYLMAPAGAAKDKLRAEIIKDYEMGLAHSEDPEVRMTLGALYKDAKDKENALKVYRTEQRLLRWEDSTSSKAMHVRLARAFKDLGDTAAAAEEDKRIAQLTAQGKKEAEEAKAKAAQEKAAQAEAARAKAAQAKAAQEKAAEAPKGANAAKAGLTNPAAPGGSAATSAQPGAPAGTVPESSKPSEPATSGGAKPAAAGSSTGAKKGAGQ